MYNRYVPQPDGTYLRHRVNDPAKASTPRPAAGTPQEQENNCRAPDVPPECQTPPRPDRKPPRPQMDCSNGNLFSFFRNLLPREIETADLLIILLLLLISGDCHEDQNTALLTLALYFLL